MNKQVSIVIPCFNEEDNVINLVQEIDKYINSYEFEIIVINDASNDNTKKKINILMKKYSNLRLLSNSHNMGQSFSIIRGIKNSKYMNIITLDGDGQNHPKDIPMMINNYFTGNYDLVSGIRKKRKDKLIKIISSKIANKIRSFILKDDCEDTGCSLKIFKKKVFLSFPEFDGIHRFIPALFKAKDKKIKFVIVHHRKRKYGKSNYGTLDRAFKGIKDIFKVLKIINLIKKNV